MKFKLYTFILFLFAAQFSNACSGGTLGSTLTPNSTYSTISVSTGKYYVVNVICGYTYNFTFCSNGGNASFDTQITINQTNNTTQLAYNDDNCGLQSAISWTASFTGTIHVLITKYSCVLDGANSGTLAFNATPPTIAYSPSCTTASVTTPTSSCPHNFTFSPIPTDGATIDSNTGFISNATEGANYTVQYTHPGGNISIPISMASSPCYLLNGDANYINVAGANCIELTAASNDQTGCAWSESQIDFNSNFSLSLDYYFGTNANGADGTTFTFQPNPGACGANGAQLGAGGISNALIVEFDTYDNDGSGTNDLTCDHIAIEIDGDLPDDPSNFPSNQAPYCGPTCAKAGGGSIENGSTHPIEIAWNATTKQLEVYFDGNLRLTCTGDFVNSVFGGQNNVYWGATAATGGLNNQQYFCPQTVVVLPTELSSFTSICTDNGTIVKWTSVSEKDLDYYVLEYSFDGFIYYPFKKSHGTGNSTDIKHYSLDISDIARKHPYLRLKMVDFNGEVKNTEIIKTADCSGNDFKVETQSIVNNVLQLHSLNGKDFNFDLIDLQGKIVLSGQSQDGNVTEKTYLSKGVYIINTQFLNTNYSQQEKVISY